MMYQQHYVVLCLHGPRSVGPAFRGCHTSHRPGKVDFDHHYQPPGFDHSNGLIDELWPIPDLSFSVSSYLHQNGNIH